jgi:hypothetical protein
VERGRSRKWRESGERVEREWRGSGEGVEREWRGSGEGVEREWRGSRGGVEREWRESGEGVKRKRGGKQRKKRGGYLIFRRNSIKYIIDASNSKI